MASENGRGAGSGMPAKGRTRAAALFTDATTIARGQ
jgi:hypothetical protein